MIETTKHPAVAIFPWLHVREAITYGKMRLLPYKRDKMPGDLEYIKQADIDGVFSAYCTNGHRPVKEGALLEWGDWQSGMNADDYLKELFNARDALIFAALAKRRLFRGNAGYCNSHTFTLCVQRYEAGHTGTFAFEQRKRDGATRYLWSSSEFAFQRPDHVLADYTPDFDKAILEFLLDLPNDEKDIWETIREFNSANTDDSSIPEHVELVMCKSALEWLLGVGQSVDDLRNAISEVLNDVQRLEVLDGPLYQKWRTARPRDNSMLYAWISEFCDLRGAAAHGQNRRAERFVWDIRTHLAFVCIFFPLIFKKVMSEKGLQLNSYDLERLKALDKYVVHNPFEHDFLKSRATHPWIRIDDDAHFEGLTE